MMPYSKHSILALDVDVNIIGQDLRQKGRNSNTKVDIHAVLNFLTSSGGDAISKLILVVHSINIVSICEFSFLNRTEPHLPLYL